MVELEVLLAEWNRRTKGIQLAMKSRGFEDSQTTDLARNVRAVGVHIANNFEMYSEALQITVALHDAFQDTPSVLERTREDIDTLEGLIKAKADRKREQDAQRREIELDLLIGSDRLIIDEQRISYGGRQLKTEQVTRLRWGVYKYYINGIRASRQFTIWIGTNDSQRDIVIECVRFLESESTITERFQTIISKIWRAVGTRILLEWVDQIMKGETIVVGDAHINKSGIVLTKRVWLRSERILTPWEELAKLTHDGKLTISCTKDRKAFVSLSLRETDNAVVLDSLLDVLWKEGNYAKLRAGTLFRPLSPPKPPDPWAPDEKNPRHAGNPSPLGNPPWVKKKPKPKPS